VIPHYLGRGDQLWVQTLCEEYQRFVGRRRRQLDERLREALPVHVPRKESRVVKKLLDQLFPATTGAPLAPKKIRWVVFSTAAAISRKHPGRRGRAMALAQSARALKHDLNPDADANPECNPTPNLSSNPNRNPNASSNPNPYPNRISTPDLCSAPTGNPSVGARWLEWLYADIPEEKRIGPPKTELPSPAELIARANLLIAQGLLARCQCVRIELDAQTHRVVRFARLLGLMCEVVTTPSAWQGATAGRHPAAGSASSKGCAQADPGTAWEWTACAHPRRQGAYLMISGPLSLYRRTLKYGRALGRLLPALAWCPRWRLEAQCLLQKRVYSFHLSHKDRLLSASPPPEPFDSKVERKFARDFNKAAPKWELLREPEPLHAGHHLIFPDFALIPRATPQKRVLLEIVGFWTPDYLAQKLARLQKVGVKNMILCIDETLDCGPASLPAGIALMTYKTRIDAGAVKGLAEVLLQENPQSVLAY
jgi:predicted nuclease of restriction endonuclease-like RecB superfamily